MPDELAMAIQEAIAWARERCDGCIWERNCVVVRPGDRGSIHTCDVDLAIAKRLAVAVGERLRGLIRPNSMILGQVAEAWPVLYAEIERLLREGSERGKE